MKIILLKSIKNLGDPGDTANVKKGYARNYLIPNKMAIYATETNLAKVENQIEKAKEFEVKNRENLQLIADKLNDEILEFALKAGDEDKLFGSVTSQMISDSLQEKGFNILKKEIIIVEPIKFIGEHIVMIDLHKDIDAKVKIMVSALPSD